jgi:type VI secretion system secreted protein Hcp
MSADYFLNIDGIPGDSTDSKHTNEIEVDSWTWGESQSGLNSTAGGGGAGKVAMSDFNFTAKVSKASPQLFLFCAAGNHVKKAQLTCRKSGGKQEEYLKVNFTDLFVSSYNVQGVVTAGHIPSDAFTLKFATIKFEYAPQKSDGSLGSPVITAYDIKQNKKL